MAKKVQAPELDKTKMIQKAVLWEMGDVDDEERSIVFTITSTALDRANEVVDAEGLDIENYKKNPVFLWSHDHSIPAIGRGMWIKKVNKIITMKVQFHTITEFAMEIYQLYKEKFLHACSIGFIPLEWVKGESEDDADYTFTKSELLEVSGCNVPCHPDALAMERAKSIVKSETGKKILLELINAQEKIATEPKTEKTEEENKTEPITKPGWEDMENEIRYRIKEPDLFETFRYKNIQKSPEVNGVYAKYKDKWTWQALRFPKADWNLADAKKWWAEHKDSLKELEDAIKKEYAEEIALNPKDNAVMELSGKMNILLERIDGIDKRLDERSNPKEEKPEEKKILLELKETPVEAPKKLTGEEQKQIVKTTVKGSLVEVVKEATTEAIAYQLGKSVQTRKEA